MRDRCGVGVHPGVRVDGGLPERATRGHHGRIVQLDAVEPVRVDVDHDGVAVLDEGDGSAEQGLGRDVADHQAHRATRETRVGHQGDGDAALAADRRDLRGGVEHLGHAGRAARALVADDDHVVVGEVVGALVEGEDQVALGVEDPRPAGEHAVDDAALHARQLQDGAAVGRQVAAQQSQPPGGFEGLGAGVDDLVVGGRRREARHLLGQGLAGAGQGVAVEVTGAQQLLHHRG